MGDNINVNVNLPPGFRFYPTDEELLVHFLQRRASLLPCHPDVIPDLDLYPYDPWQLNGKALAEGNQWYFYSRKTQNRITSNGYWKPTGIEEAVITREKRKIGIKKYFVFHLGEPPSGVKTNWILQEYSLSDSAASCATSSSNSRSSTKRRGNLKADFSKWVICRVYERNCDDGDDGAELSCLDEVFLSLDDLDEISLPN
ncbi:NAC domain-containing protein 104 [Mangifera indica]|uniref:NAC domain-containing protein 104 n=1 Tax=Mangifera indica TaxID=29780 RepID=UPI001CFBE6FD|nr:NAC domain-containing protein 104 [Mangifera indica]